MKKEKIFGTLIICFVTIYPVLVFVEGQEVEIQTIFSIALLSPNTDEARNQWALLMQKQLPKIGIDVYLHESTGWGNIGPRTWSYPLIDFDYIPTYAEGGFDVLFIGRTWEMNLDLRSLFSTGCWISGDNYYQYVNPVYDNKLNEYLTTYEPDERDQLAYELQAILYEDLPAISILYETSFFLLDSGISGFVPLLSKVRSDHSENWNHSESTDLIYSTKNELNSYNTFQHFKDNLWESCVYGSLFQRNLTNNRWEPSIAKNATIVPNYYGHTYPVNMSIIVDINPNAKFSNGDSVLAEDIKYSYEMHLASQHYFSYYTNLFSYLPYNDSTVIIDSDTVRFDMVDFYNFPLSLLSYGLIDKSTSEPIISTYGPEVFQDVPFSENVSDSLVTSCGPFKLESYNITENKVVLTKNDFWFGSPQGLNNITFVSISDNDEALDLLRQKKVDVLDENYNFQYSEFLDDNSEFIETFEVALFPSRKSQEISINMKHPIMGTGELTPVGTAEAAKYIRKAISHAIPRWLILEDILDGIGEEGITLIPPGCLGFDTSLEPYAYDLDLAIDYTEDAGFQYFMPWTTTDLFLIPALLSLACIVGIYWKKQK
ncbi:MAG: ABC transporter substrate-binding protein [Candidatus Heimdallarchaeaceae archaeon]